MKCCGTFLFYFLISAPLPSKSLMMPSFPPIAAMYIGIISSWVNWCLHLTSIPLHIFWCWDYCLIGAKPSLLCPFSFLNINTMSNKTMTISMWPLLTALRKSPPSLSFRVFVNTLLVVISFNIIQETLKDFLHKNLTIHIAERCINAIEQAVNSYNYITIKFFFLHWYASSVDIWCKNSYWLTGWRSVLYFYF